jgi:CHAD domain-containing protein
MGGFKLGGEEAPWQGLRRVAAGQIRQAIADLKNLPTEESLHNFRTATKKTRALLRLALYGAGKKHSNSPPPRGSRPLVGNTVVLSPRQQTKALIGYFGMLAKMAAPVRDLNVKIRAIKKLRKYVLNPSELRLCEFMLERFVLQLQLIDVELIKARIPAELRVALSMLRNWPCTKLSPKDLKRGWKRARTKTWKAGKIALSHPTVPRLHQWRKRAKTLWYTTRFLQKSVPDDNGKLARNLEELTELLGEDHDLALLEEALTKIPSKAKKNLRAVIAKKRLKLQQKARRFSDL